MTQETKLPPLPGALVDVKTEARAYASAAVEADRQGRMPSDDEIEALAIEYEEYGFGKVNAGGLTTHGFDPNGLRNFARALLSRYSSDRPAEVRCNHCGWFGADVDLVRDVAADEPDDGAADVCPRCKRIGDLQDIGQPAASAEPVDVRNAHAIADLVNSADQATGPIEALHEAIDRLAAPVAQEPVAWRYKTPTGWHATTDAAKALAVKAHHEMEPLYTAPVAAQENPKMPPLTEAMRAVLRNENDVYGDEDALYAALCDAAQAQSSGISGELAEPSGNSGELASAQDRADAERYRWATALDDNSETLHSIVLSYGGDQAKVNERVDVYRACDDSAAKGDDHA